MKISTLKKSVMAVALMGISLSASAQLFQREIFNFPGNQDAQLHRGAPAFGDYNNDGALDLYYGGSSWYSPIDWREMGYLLTNNGDNTYALDSTSLQRGGMLEDGTFRGHGLPPMPWSKSRWIDLDNDGNLDIVIIGKNDNDLQVPTNFTQGQHVWFYRNGGAATDYRFTKIDNDEAVIQLAGVNDQMCGGWPNQNKHFISFGDYDKDGFVDFVVTGEGNRIIDDETNEFFRFVTLYRNQGDGTFKAMNVFNPIAYAENPAPDNLFDIDETTFEPTPKMCAKPVSGGGIQMADLNNDGWLDIVYTGWADGNNGGGRFYIYKNNGDGTFTELPLSDDFRGAFEADLVVADVNNDGWNDILVTGTQNGDDMPKIFDIYLNSGAGDFTFTKSTVEDGNGLHGCSAANVRVGDVNNDGLLDILTNGWSNVDGAWMRTRLFLQNADGTFTYTDNDNSGLADWGDGSHNWELLDYNGNNSLDITLSGYLATGEKNEDGGDVMGCRMHVYTNLNTDNEVPSVPTDVKAELQDDGTVVVSWTASDDDMTAAPGLGYNVYAKDAEGHIITILAANLETGRLASLTDLQRAVRSDESTLSYTLPALAEGTYTIGVQAIDAAYAASQFATTTVAVTTGIQSQLSESVDVREVARYNAAGQLSTKSQRGLQLVKMSNGTVQKVIVK